MNNAEWCVKQGIKFRNIAVYSYELSAEPQSMSIGCYSEDGNGTYHEFYRGKKLGGSAYDSILIWFDMPHVEPILDEVERSYLAALIAPFRDKVKSVEKCRNLSTGTEYLYFNVKKGYPFYLKDFKRGTKYKGMEMYKKYRLEELGL